MFQIDDQPHLSVLLLSDKKVGMNHWRVQIYSLDRPFVEKLNNYLLYQNAPDNCVNSSIFGEVKKERSVMGGGGGERRNLYPSRAIAISHGSRSGNSLHCSRKWCSLPATGIYANRITVRSFRSLSHPHPICLPPLGAEPLAVE